VVLTIILFRYITPSSLVFLCIIPTLIFGVWTHRGFLVLVSTLVFLSTIMTFVLMFYYPENFEELGENISLVAFLYKQIYPYGVSVDLLSLMSIEVLSGVILLVFFIVLTAWFLKFDELKAMLAFGWLITLFTSLYLILNVFLYMFPTLRALILSNIYLQYFLIFFYAVLPFTTLVLMLLYLECLYDRRERKRYSKSVKYFNKKTKKRGRNMIKLLAGGVSIAFVCILLTYILIL